MTTGSAYARAALLGNPSDAYHGATVAFTFSTFRADVWVEGEGFGSPLLAAAATRFARHCQEAGITLKRPAPGLRCRSSIPPMVGLGGSSAIVVAALRALCAYHGVAVPEEVLPSVALAAEVEELGIAAGLQDRVAQVYDGLVYMDFDEAHMAQHGHGRYQRLDPGLLPPLYLIYDEHASQSSSTYHQELRRRFDAGDRRVRDTMAELAALATEGRDRLLGEEPARLAGLIDRNFDLRRSLLPLDPRHLRLVELARSAGACANFAGSGGAVVGIYQGHEDWERLEAAVTGTGCRLIRPAVVAFTSS